MLTALRHIIPVLPLIVLLGGCGQPAGPATFSPEVNVVQAAQRSVPVYAEFVGQTYGQEDIRIIPRVEGWITGIHFKEGDAVRQGQLLYTIDDLPTRSRVDAASANVSMARTVLANKKADLDRVQPLAAMNALSRRDLDAAQAAYDAALAQLQAAEAGLRTAGIEQGYTSITSPIDGVIGISSVMVGDYVGRGTLGGAINTVSGLGDVRVRFPVAETDLLAFRKRTAQDSTLLSTRDDVKLILADGSVHPESGRIDLADRSIDPGTGSILLQAVFPNGSRTLRPGQGVKVRMLVDQVRDAVLVPQAAVNQMQDLHAVFLVNDSNKVVMTPVKVGQRLGENWVITEGVAPGQRVALIGNALIDPKTPITPKSQDWDYDKTSLK